MALCTIDQLKEYVGAVDDSTDDALLTRLVDAATNVIEAYTGQSFTSTTYTDEMRTGTGTKVLTLDHFPIISITSIYEAGAAMTTGTDPHGGTSPDVLIDAACGRLIRPWLPWLPYWNYYRVTYTAGYATVPAAIVQACLDIAALMLREKEHVGLAQKTSGTQTVAYVRSLPESIQRVLDGYSDLVLTRSE